MNLKALFQLDLSGKLRKWKNNYKKSRYIFDYQNVVCGVTEWTSPEKSYTVYAQAYCNDPDIGGIDLQPIATTYQSNQLLTESEATKHLDDEITRATRIHPTTRFYRKKEDSTQDSMSFEYCENGKWHDCISLPSIRRCTACGHPVDDDICINCGEPYFGF